jgi:hypothetical protein
MHRLTVVSQSLLRKPFWHSRHFRTLCPRVTLAVQGTFDSEQPQPAAKFRRASVGVGGGEGGDQWLAIADSAGVVNLVSVEP